MNKLAVLAANYSYFLRWCRQAGIDRFSCDYISSMEDLVGKRFACAIVIKGYQDNNRYDMQHLFTILASHCQLVIMAHL